MKPTILIRVLICIALVLSAGWIGFWFIAIALQWQDQCLAKFVSPTNPADEIWFLDGGFKDRDLLLCAKSAREKPQRVASLCWFPDCGFSSAQWSGDGQVIVCSVNAKVTGDKPVMVVAYDFCKHQPVVPLWMTWSGFDNQPESEWRKQESIIHQIIADHGGLRNERIDDDVLKSKEKKLMFWQVPKF